MYIELDFKKKAKVIKYVFKLNNICCINHLCIHRDPKYEKDTEI